MYRANEIVHWGFPSSSFSSSAVHKIYNDCADGEARRRQREFKYRYVLEQ